MTDSKPSLFRFFLPNARLLGKEEVANLPPERIKAAETYRQDGLWLEIACPYESCIDEKGNITIPAKEIAPQEKTGLFLKLFCPENSCEVVQSTDLP